MRKRPYLRWVEDPDSGERLQLLPGALRERDVRVGGHPASSPGGVPRFLERFATDLDARQAGTESLSRRRGRPSRP